MKSPFRTPQDVEIYMARAKRGWKDAPLEDPQEADPGPESVLQGKIVAWCKEWGRPCLSFPQTAAVRRFLPPGWPDGVVCLPKGRVVFLELKRAKGPVKEDQKKMHLQLMALGHEVYVCRSWKRFLEIIGGVK